MEEFLLEMKNIHKHFPGVYALQGINLDLREGELLALVGENGAGKSTCINVLGGIHQKDEGEIMISGKSVDITDPITARHNGVSIIHQELVLVPHLTVAENIFLNREPGKSVFISTKEMYERSQAYIDGLGLNISAQERVADLNIAEQQMVEITKAVSFDAKIIVMDEPTSSLTEREIEALFKCIQGLKSRGIGIIYISHRLSEIGRIADRVNIFRDGKSVGTYMAEELTNDDIVRLMVGREVLNYYTRTYNNFSEQVLKVENVSNHKIHDLSFDLYRGEILGFAGLVGSGRTEAVESILGFYPHTEGQIILEKQVCAFKSPNQAYQSGFGYIPEDRRGESLFPVQSVRFNMTLRILDKLIKKLRVNHEKERELSKKYEAKMDIKMPSQAAMIQTLSGGNQQKVVIGRWLLTNPKILIMDEPTRGIDVGAKAEIYALMNELAEQGLAIIMVSSELPEIINMSDRVVVMREGTISKILSHDEISQEKIMQYAVSV